MMTLSIDPASEQTPAGDVLTSAPEERRSRRAARAANAPVPTSSGRSAGDRGSQRVIEGAILMKVGDSVRVKAGVIDPDISFDIGGWQGLVREIDGTDTVEIQWDSLTL